ncbi:MAG: hypothetical protein R2754_08750 [Microthrixaceae bacterium]
MSLLSLATVDRRHAAFQVAGSFVVLLVGVMAAVFDLTDLISAAGVSVVVGLAAAVAGSVVVGEVLVVLRLHRTISSLSAGLASELDESISEIEHGLDLITRDWGQDQTKAFLYEVGQMIWMVPSDAFPQEVVRCAERVGSTGPQGQLERWADELGTFAPVHRSVLVDHALRSV